MSFLLSLFLLIQSPFTLRVTDPWGLGVAGVQVKVGNLELSTGENGEVTLPASLPGEFEVEIVRTGFEPIRRTVTRWSGTQEFQLKVASVLSAVSVTATRTERLATETPTSITVLDSE